MAPSASKGASLQKHGHSYSRTVVNGKLLYIENSSVHLKGVLRSCQYLILVYLIKLCKIPAPAPDAHYQIFVLFGMILSVQQLFAADNVQLHLMTAQVYEFFHQICGLDYTFLVTYGV